MSADYWLSSQRTTWQFTRELLMESRRKLVNLEKRMVQSGLIKEHPQIACDVNMRIYLHTLLVKLGRRLNVRQVALASAEVYMTRFLTRVLLKEVNAYLLVTTCLYVACKIEECPQHIRLLISEARNLWPEYIPYDVTKLAEFEFYLIEEMELYLVLHHPYKLLLQLKEHTSETNFELTDDELQHLWLLINDSYVTDLHLVFPPHILALAAVYVTLVLKKSLVSVRGGRVDEAAEKVGRFMHFFNHSHVNLEQVMEAMQEMVNLYVQWDRYNEASVRKVLQAVLLAK